MDLSTTYLGLALSSPLVASASPLSRRLDAIRHLEDSGAGAVVLFSLFQEQVEWRRRVLARYLVGEAVHYPEALAYFGPPAASWISPEAYCEHIRQAKAAVAIPIIASLNGVCPGEWLEAARDIEQAGADALEVNVYFTLLDPALPSASIEQNALEVLQEVKRRVHIPVAMKLVPYFTNLAGMAHRLDQAGVDGLVLFNRFYQPDIDLARGETVPRPTLSTPQSPEALRLPLRWIALLSGHLRADLAGSGGVHVAQDALKLLLAGASVAMLASELLEAGIDRLRTLTDDLRYWMEQYEYPSVAALRGRMSQQAVPFPAAFERAAYLQVVSDPHDRRSTGDEEPPPIWQPAPTGYGGTLRPPSLRRPLNYNHGKEP
jgi:dihydroorotate dehydrogenase (fumarate)